MLWLTFPEMKCFIASIDGCTLCQNDSLSKNDMKLAFTIDKDTTRRKFCNMNMNTTECLMYKKETIETYPYINDADLGVVEKNNTMTLSYSNECAM